MSLLRLGLIIFFSLLPVAEVAGAQSVRFSGTTAVGSSSAPLSVTITVAQAGTLDSVKVRTQGSDGLDFSDRGGGTCAPGQSYLQGQQCTVTAGFAPTAPGNRAGAVVLLDQTGTVLGQRGLYAAATGSVTTFVPGRLDTLAGDAVWIYGGDGGPANQSSIFLPFGVAVDGAGNVLIADSSNNRVRRVDAVTGLISTVAGNGLLGSKGDGGSALAASLSNPTAVTLDAAGNLYVTDSGNNVIRRVSAFDGSIITVAGTMRSHGYAGDGGAATGALLNGPNGIAFDADGNLYLADTGNAVVRMVSAATGVITTVAGTGAAGFSGDGGPALTATLNGPWSVTVASGGGFYIADQNNHVIRLVSAAGVIQTVVGTGQAGFSGDNGPPLAAQLNVPAGVVVDVAGNLYVADSGNNRVRKVNVGNGLINTVAGTASESISGDGGPANAASLYGPYALALDGQGSLLIADVFHNRIRKLTSNQAVLQYAPIRVGRVSGAQVAVVENDGNTAMNVSALLPASNAQLDPVTTTCSAAVPLAPLARCTVGADFAPQQTGAQVLGEVDVKSDAGNSPGKMVLEGQVLDVDPTTLTLASTPNPSATGSAVTFQVTASSDGSTPVGTATLLDGANSVGTAPLQAGGVASFSLRTLTAGSHSMTAQYGGDGSNSAATSAPVVQVVRDAVADTVTTLASSVNPVDAGAVLALTASVMNKADGNGSGPLTGTVAFLDGLNQLGTANVTGGVATLNVSSLAVGTHVLVANYKGATDYGASSSQALSEMVRLATTKAALSTSASPAVAGAALTLTVSVLSSGGVPAGPVSFSDGGVPLGVAQLNAQGIATLVVPGAHWSVGTHVLAASYAGDANDAGCVAPMLTQVVALAMTQVSVGSGLNPAGQGAAVTFTVNVRGTGGLPGGAVQVLDGATVLGTVTLDAAGAGSFTTSALTVGSHAITAAYVGDADDAESVSPVLMEVVKAATTAVSLSTSANPSVFGAGLVLTATVSGSGSVATGLVTFLDATTVLGTAALDAAGNATLTKGSLPIGAHSLSAVYAGDAVHGAASSGAVAQRIVQSTTTGLTLTPARIVAGLPVQGAIQVTGVNGKAMTGAVTVMEGGAVLATVTPDASGSAQLTLPQLAPGTHALVASYAGDPDDLASSSAAVALVVDVAATSTTLRTSANPAGSGTPLTLTASVTGNGAMPGGSVSFLDGTGVLSVVPLVNGSASLTTAALIPGVHQLTASYSGDADDHASSSPAVAQQVALQTTLTLRSSANPALLADAVTITVQAGNGTAGAAPSGTVNLTDGGTVLATLTLDGTGAASYTMSAPSLGLHTLGAAYAGDARNGAASSQPLVEQVVLRPTSNSFTASVKQLSAGQQIVLISVVQGGGPRMLTGQVTFASGATVLGTATVDGTGLATLTVKPLQGLYNVVGTYSGDALYASSTSQSIAITVGPPIEFTLNVTPPTLTLASGQHVSMQVDLTTAATFKDTLALSCAGLPAAATCVFSDNQIAVGGGVPKSFTVTLDTGNPLGSGSVARLDSSATGPWLCMLPAGAVLALLLRRRRFRAPLGLLSAVLLLAAMSVLSGCGNSFSQSATPAGGYTFQIVGTGNVTGATQNATVVLTVTK